VTPPNVLIILADDQRFDFLPYMPNTRNLIAFQGREFTHCRCNVALCQPTRVSLLTGQYSKHHGVLAMSAEALANIDQNNTLAAWIHAAGYRTGLVGKYLNGAPAMIPQPNGWDTWRQLTETTGYGGFDYEVCDGTTLTTPTPFQMDYLREEAKTFVAGSEPWFLLLAPTAPHAPFDPDPRDLFAWSDIRWPIVNEINVSDKPSWIANQPPLPALASSGFRAIARAQLREGTALDRAIGEIIGSIPPVVLANTLVVYSSDNGLTYGEHRLPFGGVFKNSAYDPGLRVPLVMRGPEIPVGVSEEPVTMAADVTATVVEMSGAIAGLTADGVDLRDVIANPGAYQSRQLLHARAGMEFLPIPPGDGISTLTRKLYRYPSIPLGNPDRYEAYDLDIDPDEDNNWANDPLRRFERDALEVALDNLLVP
jgi:N-acetylglucosamine-6-sulfatase